MEFGDFVSLLSLYDNVRAKVLKEYDESPARASLTAETLVLDHCDVQEGPEFRKWMRETVDQYVLVWLPSFLSENPEFVGKI